MSSQSFTTTNHGLVLGPQPRPRARPRPRPRTPGPGPIAGAASGPKRQVAIAIVGTALVRGRADDRDRNRRMEPRTDCTIRAPRRSSVLSRPVQCHRILASYSPPFHLFSSSIACCPLQTTFILAVELPSGACFWPRPRAGPAPVPRSKRTSVLRRRTRPAGESTEPNPGAVGGVPGPQALPSSPA